jgi:hypothetical protein
MKIFCINSLFGAEFFGVLLCISTSSAHRRVLFDHLSVDSTAEVGYTGSNKKKERYFLWQSEQNYPTDPCRITARVKK